MDRTYIKAWENYKYIRTHQKAFVWLKTDLTERIAERRLTIAIPDT